MKHVDLVNMRCKERNHYNNLVCQHCWLLYTSHSDIQNGKNMRGFKHFKCPTRNFFLHSNKKAVVSKEHNFNKM